MPIFPAPRFLRPARADDVDFHVREDFRQVDTVDGVEKMQAILAQDPGREKTAFHGSIRAVKGTRKDRYGFSTCFFGPYAIKPFVTDIIIAPREHAPSFLYYVGGAFIGDDRIEHLTTSNIGSCSIRTEPHNGSTLVLARVQIMAPFGGPVYEVVVGELVVLEELKKLRLPTPKLASRTYRELRIRSGEITGNPNLVSPGRVSMLIC